MINYAPREEEENNNNSNSGDNDGDVGGVAPEIEGRRSKHHFEHYHDLHRDGSVTVLSDRNVEEGNQILEEYGELDNSLYIEAHGFVPSFNPFHCANIETRRYWIEEVGRGDDNGDGEDLIQVMVSLGLLPPNRNRNGIWDIKRMANHLPDMCILSDGSISDDVDGATNALMAITALHFPEARSQRSKCMEAYHAAKIDIDDESGSRSGSGRVTAVNDHEIGSRSEF